MLDYQRKKDKVILVGKGYEWWKYPKNDPDYEVWGINDVIMKEISMDLMFNIHKVEDYSEVEMSCTKLASALGIPIIMTEEYKHLPTSIRFPLEEAMKDFDTDYYMTGIAFMFAYAIYKGYKQIDCYGINMRGADEQYKNARACVEFWIGFAMGRGIKVNMFGKYCDCLKTFDRRIYGFNDLQTRPQDINDRALFVTFAASLDRPLLDTVHKWLSVQKNSKFFNNMQPIPLNDPNSTIFFKAMKDLVVVHGDGTKFVGDAGFYHNLHTEELINNEHSCRIIIFKGDKEKSIEDWLEFAKRYETNPWTNPKSLHWNGDKYHDVCNFFPKYDLPKEEALRKFYDDYYTMAARSQFRFPGYIRLYDKEAIDTEEGRKEILKFLGYQEDEMVFEIPEKPAPIPPPLVMQAQNNPREGY